MLDYLLEIVVEIYFLVDDEFILIGEIWKVVWIFYDF